MKRAHLNSDVDGDDVFSFTDEFPSENFSEVYPSGRRKNKLRKTNDQEDFSRTMNDSGLHSISLSSETDSDVYQRLVQFSQKDLSEIITTILGPDFELNAVLDDMKVNTSCLFLFMKIMSVVCKSNSGLKIEILLNLSKSSLPDIIRSFLQKIIDDTNPVFSEDIRSFLDHLTEFYSSIFILLPEIMVDINLKEIIANTITASQHLENCCLLDTFFLRFKLNDFLVNVELYPLKPPQTSLVPNFRACSLYPTCEDLQRNAGCVERNLTRGMYVSVEHYLNVHFHLLRESFHKPIRMAIQNYLNSGDNVGSKPWSKVIFRQITFKARNMCYEVKIERGDESESWSDLLYGSLVVFSDNNFVTFFFGVVVEWNVGDSLLVVTFLDGVDVPLNGVLGFAYVMLMTTINLPLFNYPILMKAFASKSNERLPLVRYLVNAEIVSPSSDWELRKRHRANVVHTLCSHDKLMMFADATLDVCQFSALKSALSDPITLIAGPHGTGKTFLAGKIVQVVLHGENMRSTVQRFPILMICRSNEALDQFLRVVRNFTTKMVRIGGRTSDGPLSEFNLRALRRSTDSAVAQKVALLNLQRLIKGVSDEINAINEYAGVVSFNLLKYVMAEKHLRVLDEQRLLALLLDEDGFSFDYAKSTGTMEERLESSVWAELDLCRAINKCADKLVMPEISSSPNDKRVSGDEFFVDDSANSDCPPVTNNDRPADRITYAITVQKCTDLYRQKVLEMETKFSQLKKHSKIDCGELYFVVEHVQMLRRNLHTLKIYLENLTHAPRMNDAVYNEMYQKDFYLLSVEERWKLYGFWVSQLRSNYVSRLQEYIKQYRNEVQNYDRISDLQVLSEAFVVGVTSPCLTKFQSYFEILQPSMVIVEEATEIIEAEIVSSLSEACEQLILLGDLHSMKPSTPNSKFSKTHFMDVSLFERLMNNGLKYHQLKIQRDVPLEINSVLRSTFLIDLYHNTPFNAMGLPKVKGFTKNVFFLNHYYLGQGDRDVLTAAEYISKMCVYLVNQKIITSDISVLAIDAKQISILREKLDRASNSCLKAIEVVSLESYRSKTNRIVLLSFVNAAARRMDALDKKRVFYTALTRATQALYMVGSVEYLTQNFEFWSSIRENLTKCTSIGDRIILTCEKHNKVNPVSATDNFWTGCGEICGAVLQCGHSCSFPCHLDDPEHAKNFLCQTELKTQCNSGHLYLVKCGAGYQLCPVEVAILSRYCGHSVTKRCGECLYSTNCSQTCKEMLPCGHQCQELCHRLRDPTHKKVRCREKCGKTHVECTRGHICEKFCWERCGFCFKLESCVLKCGHETKILCSFDISRVKCYEKCTKICQQCGERCKKYCFEDCHPCTNEVLKFIDGCGHEKLMECGTTPESDLCDAWINIYSVMTPCGHNQLHIPCSLKNEDLTKLSRYCSVPCGAILYCGHTCVGTCGSCIQGRLHSGCSAGCETVYVCGHRCESLCEKPHPLCDKNCTYYCQHQKCNAECGLPCLPCKVICEWKCKHSACTRTCSEICDRSPCFEPCDQILTCGHPCIGFCGEPCPPLCRFCDQELLAINYPNDIESSKTRFVLLTDCQHVVESRAVEVSLYRDCRVSMKKCPYPFCQKPIFNTLRYRNSVKQYYQHIRNIKKMYLTDNEIVRELNISVNKKLEDVWKLFYRTDMNLAINDVENTFQDVIREVNNQRSSIVLLQSLSYYSDLMLDMGSRYHTFKKMKFSHSFPELLNLANEVNQCVHDVMLGLKQHSSKISIQQVNDLRCEVDRFHKMIDYCLMVKFGASVEARQSFSAFQSLLCAPGKFTDERNKEINCLIHELQRMLQCSIPVSALMSKNIPETETIKMSLFSEKHGHWCICRDGHYYRCVESTDFPANRACPYCNTTNVNAGNQKDWSVSFLLDVLNTV